jgi:hypothetical protein
MKLTKQGVRDLNHLKAPPGLKLDLPPPGSLICSHPKRAIRKTEEGKECFICGTEWPARQ